MNPQWAPLARDGTESRLLHQLPRPKPPRSYRRHAVNWEESPDISLNRWTDTASLPCRALTEPCALSSGFNLGPQRALKVTGEAVLFTHPAKTLPLYHGKPSNDSNALPSQRSNHARPQLDDHDLKRTELDPIMTIPRGYPYQQPIAKGFTYSKYHPYTQTLPDKTIIKNLFPGHIRVAKASISSIPNQFSRGSIAVIQSCWPKTGSSCLQQLRLRPEPNCPAIWALLELMWHEF